MLIKVKCKHYPTKDKCYPKCVECHVNGEHVGFIGPLDWDEPECAIEEAPFCCDVDIDGQTRKFLFSTYNEYNDFIGQVMAGCLKRSNE